LDAKEEIGLIYTALITIQQLICALHVVNGNGADWNQLADRVESIKRVLYKHYEDKALFTGMLLL
jgi:metal-responsive CopG/Arc/MetJ family transcriptional regulator